MSSMHKRPAGQSLWRMHVGMAVFWLALLGVLYVLMDRYLQPSAAVATADGGVQLQRQRNGHFYIDGSVNGQPVRFLVDTGASSIAVSDALAARAGLQGGQVVDFQTANGTRTGRLVRADRVSAGPLQVRNLTVGTGYTGSSEADALLGQNFLRHFRLSMHGDVMQLQPL